MTVLEALGGRFDVLCTIDFETYFDPPHYSVKHSTTESYVRDPRFETIGVGVKWGDQPSVWLEDHEFRAWAARVDWSRVSMCAHHAHFDGLILSHHYGIRPGFWLDTMSMGRMLHGTVQGVSLDRLTQLYGVGTKGDEVDNAKGKRRADFTQEEWERYGEYCKNDCDLTDRLLRKMVARLPVEELWSIDGTIRKFTEPKLEADQVVLNETLLDERAAKASFLERSNVTKDLLSSNDKFAELLRTHDVDPPLKPSPSTDGLIYAFAKTDAGFQELLEHPQDEVRFLAEARLAVKSTIVETRTERLAGIGKRGRVPIYLKHAGAHTHRWSGGDKMNPQNFNRGGALRRALVAPPGHVLVVGDLSQIEARVNPWLAGQEETLDVFRAEDKKGEDGDFYSAEGSRFFGKPLSKKTTPVERQSSKSMILGLGYGLGFMKFAESLLKGFLGAPPVQFGEKEAETYGVNAIDFERRAREFKNDEPVSKYDRIAELTSKLSLQDRLVHFAVTERFVNMYREANPKIVATWWAMNDALALMAPDEGDDLRAGFRGILQFKRHAITCPNGTTLLYPGLASKQSPYGVEYSYLDGHGKKRKKTYGGSLVENIVQKLARDIIAEQELWIRARYGPSSLSTHDELGWVIPEGQADECAAHMLRCLRKAPRWCEGLPLNASVAVGRRYSECH